MDAVKRRTSIRKIGTLMDHYQHLPTTHQSYRNSDTSDSEDSLLEKSTTDEPSTLHLIRRLCQALAAKRIAYCHWKSNNVLDRSASGDNDLDLLVSRADIPRFTGILYGLGFKQAEAPAEKQMPGVLDYYGYDEEADRLIHVHAHYQLILGHDMTKNYRLPVERSYIESAVQGDLFKVPASEFEFIVFVIRMILKHSTWDAIIGGQGALNLAERKELSYLQDRLNQERVLDLLKQNLASIDIDLFNKCVRALRPDCSTLTRIRIGRQLQARLQSNARRPQSIDTYLKLWRRVSLAIRRRIFKSLPTYRLESGGAMIAIVGGDGAGKTTAVDSLYTWLSKTFETTRVHLGKPSWSATTIAIRGFLKIWQLIGLYPPASSFRETPAQKSLVSPGYPWLLREACTARDRYRTYIRARRFTAKGGLAVCDRFPLPQIRLMDGPLAAQFIGNLTNGPQAERFMSPKKDSPLAKALVKIEESYYDRIMLPDLLIVLRVVPEIAVQRKTDENGVFVRERSTEIWKLNWQDTNAHIIDAGKSKADVLAELKTLIWSNL